MGKFVEPDDVKKRYEGAFPDDRGDWLSTKIDDVEADLILMVPSLAAETMDQISPIRLQKVKSLVADKVLELYRNPERAKTRTQAAGPFNESTTYDTGSGKSPAKGYFTDDEVATLRVKRRRSNIGVALVKPSVPGPRPCR